MKLTVKEEGNITSHIHIIRMPRISWACLDLNLEVRRLGNIVTDREAAFDLNRNSVDLLPSSRPIRSA